MANTKTKKPPDGSREASGQELGLSSPPSVADATPNRERSNGARNLDRRGGLGPIYNANELLGADFPELREIVPGILPEGLAILAGAPKVGKSWLAWALGLAVASGGKALGKLDVEPGRVLMFALEDSPRRLADRTKKMLGSGGIDQESGERIQVIDSLPPNVDPTNFLRAQAKSIEDLRLIVLDTWPKFRPTQDARQTGAYDYDYKPLSRIQEIAIEAGICILGVHHTRKDEAKDWIHGFSGSTGLTAAADSLLGMFRERGRADAILRGTGRDMEDFDHAMTFDAATGLWSITGPATDATLGGTRFAILQLLREQGPMRAKPIAEDLGIPFNTVKSTLRRMDTDGQLVADAGLYDLPALGGAS